MTCQQYIDDTCKYVEVEKNLAKAQCNEKLGKIAQELRIELEDVQTLTSKDLTTELEDSLHSQLYRVFSILRKHGVQI